MKKTLIALSVFVLCGCGLESVGAAAAGAKLQAEQAKEGQKTIENVRAKMDAAEQASAERAKQAEQASE